MCGKGCMRPVQRKRGDTSSKVQMRCRFGYPRESSAITQLIDSAVVDRARKSGGKLCRNYLIKRAPNATNVNDYNADIMYLWQANMDIRYVTDPGVA